MKIVLVDSHLPDNRISMQLFVRCLSAGLENCPPLDVRVLSPNPAAKGKLKGAIQKFLILPIKLWRQTDRETIVHLCDTSHAIILMFLRRRTIVTVHDLGAFEERSSGVNFFRRIWRGMLVKGLERAEVLVCVSESSRAEAKRYLPKECHEKITLILNSSYQNFPDFEDAIPNTGGVNRFPVNNSGRRYLLHIGSNEPRKNRAFIVEVLARLNQIDDYGLILAGREPDAKVRNALIQAGMLQRTIIIKDPTAAELAYLYQRSEALLFPSTYEGFGIPVAEAAMNGCPVVCSAIPSHQEILTGYPGLIHGYDVQTYVDAVRRLAEPAVRREMIALGRQLGARFHPSRMVADYANLYQSFAR